MSLFDAAPLSTPDAKRPLAERMRPQTLDDYAGQEHILGPGKPLRVQIERDELQSLILWGPPGVGKTTLAQLVARMTKCEFVPFSAVLSGIKCIKPGGRLLLYIYETGAIGWINLRHRFPLPSRLPRPLMLLCCRLMAVPLCFYLVGRRGRLPTMRTWRTAELGLLDAYLPRYSHTHDAEECMGWLREAGLVDVKHPEKCFFTAVRPA